MPSSWLGTPSVSRRTMLGGVRTESSTSVAPPSARSTAISAPELPLPTTRTRLPAVGGWIAVVRRVDDLAREFARPIRDERHVALPRRDHDPFCCHRAARRSHRPAAGVLVDTLDLDTRREHRGRGGPRSAADTRQRVHARATSRTPAGSGSREGPTASEPCAAAACRSVSPRRPRPRRARARRRCSPTRLSIAAAASPEGPRR